MSEKFLLPDILKVTRGRLLQDSRRIDLADFSLFPCQICTDTRKLKRDDLFLALLGKRFDGHDFVREAWRKGACGAIVARSIFLSSRDFLLIQVEDSLRALQELAKFHREGFSLPLVGVTGSNGKTTVKEMIWEILSQKYSTLKSEGNLNNQIGVPLSLLRLSSGHEAGVLEMGMNSGGEIQRLAEIIQPRIGVITNIHHSHLGFLGSREKIKEAKAEIIPILNRREDNWLVLNEEDDWTNELKKRTKCRTITFGMTPGSEVRAEDIQDQGEGGVDFVLTYRKERKFLHLSLPGKYNVYNALAASAVGLLRGLSLDFIARGLSELKPIPLHSEISILGKHKLIDDSYNANPESMEEALRLLRKIGDGRKIAILGDMLELGEKGRFFHHGIGIQAGRLGIDALFAYGELSEEMVKGAREERLRDAFFFKDKEELMKHLFSYLGEEDCLLVKGSRGMRMDEVAQGIRMRLCSAA